MACRQAKSDSMPPDIINQAHIGRNSIRNSLWSGWYPMPCTSAPVTPSNMIGNAACNRLAGTPFSMNGNSINAAVIASAARNEAVRSARAAAVACSGSDSCIIDFALRVSFEP
jgi:hypothetical protein